MVMTDPIKKAFRIAYDTLEKIDVPRGSNEQKAIQFESISQRFGFIEMQNQENPLVGPLLLGLYEYLDKMSKTGEYVK